jgi:threonylcarbamoyladenosine tRNA methylthiotransferase MtaB
MKNYFIIPLGCKLSQFDAAAFGERLASEGLRPARAKEESDLIVISSCTVTGKSDAQSRQLIRKVIREHPDKVVAVTGCYARREEKKVAAIAGVDLVIPDVYQKDLPAGIRAMKGKRKKARTWPGSGEGGHFFPITRFGTRTRPFVKVQDGCNAQCAYCVVRLVRGESRSVPAAAVLDQVRLLAREGFKEVVLTGINIGLWGRDLPGGDGLLSLLRLLEKDGGIPRIRLSSIEPSDISAELIDYMAASPVMVEHFHIPLQSGCERILRCMNRPYSADRYGRLITSVREKLPDAAIGADVMTGFPGEDEAAFEETRDFITRLPFTYLHVFSYSKRPDTAASRLDGEVHGACIRKRTRRLRALSKEKNLSFRKRYLGRALSCLLLQEPNRPAGPVALSRNYIRVRVPENAAPANRIARVRVEGVTDGETRGSVIALED